MNDTAKPTSLTSRDQKALHPSETPSGLSRGSDSQPLATSLNIVLYWCAIRVPNELVRHREALTGTIGPLAQLTEVPAATPDSR